MPQVSHARLEALREDLSWVCLGAVVALGFLVVPKRAAVADLAALNELARTDHLVVNQRSRPRGLCAVAASPTSFARQRLFGPDWTFIGVPVILDKPP
jgi:hypothetical protein